MIQVPGGLLTTAVCRSVGSDQSQEWRSSVTLVTSETPTPVIVEE